jgi:hypothetical protein
MRERNKKGLKITHIGNEKIAFVMDTRMEEENNNNNKKSRSE